MSLVPSLLQAIVRVDGEALVMHAGDKPYVVSPTGQVDLASRGLTLEAVNGIVAQLLPIELQNALDEFGAVQHELAPMAEFPGEHFTVVAARGGDDVWTEIRRRRVPEDDHVPEEFFAPFPPHAVASQSAVSHAAPAHQMDATESAPAYDNDELPVEILGFDTPAVEEVAPQVDEAAEVQELDDDLLLPDAGHLWPGHTAPARTGEVVSAITDDEVVDIDVDVDGVEKVEAEPEPEPMPVQPAAQVWTPPPAPAPIPSVTAAPPAQSVAHAVASQSAVSHAAPAHQMDATESAPAYDNNELPVEIHGFDTPAVEEVALQVDEAAEVQELDDDLLLPDAGHLWLGHTTPARTREAVSAITNDEVVNIDVDVDGVEKVEAEPEPMPVQPAAQVWTPPPAPAHQMDATESAPAYDNDELPVEILGFDTPAVEEVAPQVDEAAEVQELDDDLLLLDATESAPAYDNDELPVEILGFDTPAVEEVAPQVDEAAEVQELDDDLLLRDAGHLWPGHTAPARTREAVSAITDDEVVDIDVDVDGGVEEVEAEPEPMPVQPAAQVWTPPPAPAPIPSVTAAPPAWSVAPPVAPAAPPRQAPPIAASVEPPRQAPPIAASVEPPRQAPPIAASVEPPRQVPPIAASVEPPRQAPPPPQPRAVPPPQPVLNISRNPIRSEMPPPVVEDPTLSGLERLLRVSSARGASTLYLSSESRPSVRVDGELQMLDGEPVHVARDVESLLLTLMPERSHEALRTGAATEWICDLEGVGRVRCMSFRDQRGPGGVFRLMPTRSVSADQLGLPKQVQALAIEPEGLVLVAGPRSSGKRTMMSAFVDLMNRTRRDHIITIEREINIQHERGNSFISQREVRGSDEDVLAAARAAMREDPDVLVIEDLRTGALMNVALEAAAAGRLVVGGFSAHTATGAIDRIIDLYAPEYRRQVQMALADSMRGVIAQVLLRKIGGGRLPAREVLLNTPAVSSVIAEGKTSQLPMAIEGGRRYGMMPLNDALVGLVQSGAVEAREAYRNSPDRPGFLAALNRQGLDTSFVERLA